MNIVFLDANCNVTAYRTIEIAQSMGYSVVFITENRLLYEHLPLNPLQKANIILDVKCDDVDAVVMALENITNIQAVIALDDSRLFSEAAVSERLNLPTSDTLINLRSVLMLKTMPATNIEDEVIVRKVELNDQKKTIVVLRSGEILENWPNIKRELDCNYVMVGASIIIDILRQNDWIDLFDLVVSTEKFDFMNIRKIIEGILPIKCLNNIKFVTANEVMLLACAQLNETFHSTLIASDNTDYFLNKDKMKRRIAAKYLPKYFVFNPNNTSLNEIQNALVVQGIQFPVFIKPINGSSSRDVKKCHNEHELALFIEKIKYSPEQFEIDEFISGDLYHCDSIIQRGKIVATMIGRYYAPCADFLNGVPCGSFPVLESDPLFSRIKAFADEILNCLPNLENYVTHMELFVQEERLIFVEVAARPAGGRICEMYEHTHQLNIIDCAFRTQLDLCLPEKAPTGNYAAWFIIPIQAGIVTHIVGDDFFKSFKSNCSAQWFIKVNQSLSNPAGLWSVAVSIFLTNSNLEQLTEDYQTLGKATLFKTVKLAHLLTKQSPLINHAVEPPTVGNALETTSLSL